MRRRFEAARRLNLLLRLFTALELPSALAGQLAACRGGIAGARWVAPGDLHLTLCFIGAAAPARAEEIDRHLARLECAAADPLEIELDGAGLFAARAGPRALYAKLRPAPALRALQRQVARALVRAGHAPERRRFTPHITLARLRAPDQRQIQNWTAAHALSLRQKWTASRFALFSARPGGGGPYRVERVYPLSARAACASAESMSASEKPK